jgi:glycosyltransferase involved in cell wall biosynthesis
MYDMKTLLVLTFVDFWRKGSGHRARINSMLSWLQTKVHITVFLAGIERPGDRRTLDEAFPGVDVVFACPGATLTFREYAEKFRAFIERQPFDIALVEYIELSEILKYLPAHTITVLDTHDLVFARVNSFNQNNVCYDGITLSKEEELDIYGCYDYVILIQKTDFNCIAEKMDAQRLLLTPHPASLKKQAVREKVSQIGYMASPYSPNLDALKWFIDEIWDRILDKYALTLNIYGNIKNTFEDSLLSKSKNIVFHGFVEDLEKIYEHSDVMINPVRCGAGLTIKNVETLGYGLPLITTTHGASGMEDGASTAFFVANDPGEYMRAFDAIVGDYTFRMQLAESALKYANMHFSQESCYKDLLRIIT